ncbi:PilC beta-propeller domain protein [Acinetobacter sp. WC-323]|uniref:PilC/PilY family type IV pilus protein n=1 Tax=Acinetobacter sp. WC-323 TaxID=903918 RepID=UPI00029E138A|nr:PilC/PilY family type IV pilus protein [Acinetobacter sp. WC-323]EKU53483.1 PilC beta-propeller domain protein [Acinetobacter sp. WC-323]
MIDSQGLLRSTKDYWSIGGLDGKDATKGGALSKLPVQTAAGRKIYSDRTVSGSTISPITTSGTALTLIDSKNTTDTTGTAEALRNSNDPDRAYLLNLLGFGINTLTPPANLTGAAQLRQMGATLNSTPLFFTTKSKIATKKVAATETTPAINIGDYIDRKDYVLFGTNQGLLQVVDADTGVEKFAFLPKEMIDRQKKGFVAKSLQTSASTSVGNNLYQGIDGAWSVYTNYVANNASNSLKASTLNVYGGMRRGGYNYYALDLKDMETSSPNFLFKVGPQQSVDATTGALTLTGTCSDATPLDCMGQSWSKPTIAWIKWKGKPQLVMIVGGGYDECFNKPDFKLGTTYIASDWSSYSIDSGWSSCNNISQSRGNGIYIFAANTNTDTGLTAGALLWWGSSTATGNTANATNDTRKTNNPNLKYSVVSEIKAIDRDSDGFVDNLYFGDLGGQVFRVDIDNASSGTVTTATSSTTKNMVVKRIQRIANFITDAERSTRAAPRFYTMPTFTVHSLSATSTTGATTTSYSLGGVRGNANRFAVISIGSGDVSNPVKNSLSTSNGIPDRIYGIFDRDVGRHDLYANANDSDTTGANATTDGLRSKDITTVNMVDLTAIGTSAPTVENMVAITNHGWYHTLADAGLGRSGTNVDSALTNGIARYKVLSSFAAIKNTLFTSYFDAADNGSSSSCSAGVKGRSYVKNYCLPFGSMGSNGSNCRITETDGRGFSTANTIGSNVGAGIVPVVVGGMTNNQIGPITGVGRDSGVKAAYTTPIRFEPITWYSKRS